MLQVGHHGSSTSTSYLFLNAVLPEMGIISCGVNNKYGHPHEETLSILRDAGVDVYRTDLQGTITIGSDGQNYTVGTEHFAADSALNPTDPAASSTAQQAYIGNVNSKKFHLPTCPNLPAEKNQVLFSSYEEAVEAAIRPVPAASNKERTPPVCFTDSPLWDGAFGKTEKLTFSTEAPSLRKLARREL